MGQAFLWKPGVGVEVTSASFETFETEAFRQSPVRRVIDARASLRRKLGEENCPIDFEATRELKTQGATDFLVVPLFFASRGVHGATFATQQPGGFTDAQIAAIESVVAPLARVAENRLLERTASVLLDTHVCNNAGIPHSQPDKSGAARHNHDQRGDLVVGYARFHPPCRSPAAADAC